MLSIKWKENEKEEKENDGKEKKAHKLTTQNTVLQMRSKCVTMYVLVLG